MMPRLPVPVLAAATLLLLGGCAKDADLYPSLSIREAERVSGTFQPVQPEQVAEQAPGAQTLDRLESLRADARKANERFLAAAARARGPVAAARGSAPGSEAWSVAQVALADLESSRSDAMIALADLDRIYIDARLDVVAFDRIEQVRGEVATMVDSQDQTINTLHGELGD